MGKNLGDINIIVTIGYPFSQKDVKPATGVVSGFHGDGDDEEENPFYVQIIGPINPGNSNYPLLYIKINQSWRESF